METEKGLASKQDLSLAEKSFIFLNNHIELLEYSEILNFLNSQSHKNHWILVLIHFTS